MANPTTTPAISFTPLTAAQGAVLAGPSTGGTGAYSFRSLVSNDLPSAIAATTLTGSTINGYITVDGTVYTTLNLAWTAAAAICTTPPGSLTSPTIVLGPGVYTISAPLVEPETTDCGVNLVGSGDGINDTSIVPSTTFTTPSAVIYKGATYISNSGLTFRGFTIECSPYVSGTGYVTYANYGIWLQWARFTRIVDVNIQDCGTSAAGENLALGEDSSPSGHAFGGNLYNVNSSYNESIYTGPGLIPPATGPIPPAYGIEFKSTALDSNLLVSTVKNAQTASFVFQAGTSDIKTFALHGYGYANSGTGPYRPQYVIQDFGSQNVRDSPILDTFREAGIDMEGTYNPVVNPTYEWSVTPDTSSYLFEVGTNAKWDKMLDGQCHALSGSGMVSSAYLFKDGHTVSVAPAGWTYQAPSACLFSYEWEDTSTFGRSHNYTTYAAGATFTLFDLYIRNKSGSSGSHNPLLVFDSSTNVLLKTDDYGDLTTGSLATSTITFTSSGSVANGTGTAFGNATSGAITITLPTCSTSSAPTTGGRQIVVQKTDSSGNNVTVAASGAQTINGVSTLVLSAQYAAKKRSSATVRPSTGSRGKGDCMKPSGQQILPLTSMRFFAAFYVVLFHTLGAILPAAQTTATAVGRLISLGYVSVSLFFVLSGYILAVVYLRPGSTAQAKDFCVARFARIYPLLVATLLLDIPFGFLRTRAALLATGKILLANLLLLRAWRVDLGGLNNPCWSLSVEAFFYALFPILGLLLRKKSPKVLILLAGLSYAVGLLLVLGASRLPISLDLLKYCPLLHLHEFVEGVCCGLIALQLPHRRKLQLSAWAPAALACCAVVFAAFVVISPSVYYPSIHDGLLSPLFVVVILSLAHGSSWVHRALSNKWLVLLGESSFALYLVHIPIWHRVEHTVFGRSLFAYPLLLAGMIGASIASF